MNNLKLREKIMLELMQSTRGGGRIFGVVFQKRSTGKLRAMTCRLGVHKGVKGIGGPYIPDEKNLLTVYEMPQSHFRMIPIEGVRSLTIDGLKIAIA